MNTVNSLSGGKTSSFIAANYPADFNVFALVRTDDKNCLFPDDKIRQIVSDKIGQDFIGTLEDDVIIYTMLDLEQYIGSPIQWVTGKTFDKVIERKNGIPNLPQPIRRFCTTEMKLQPIFDWWRETINEPVEMRIGFRANELRRAKNMTDKLNENGYLEFRGIVGKSKNGAKNKWADFEWQKPVFPLIEDIIFKDKIEEYWKDKPVRFAWMNNCVGCMHKEPILLKKMMQLHPNKLQWFIDRENEARKMKGNTWRQDVTYEQIAFWNAQYELFDDDFNDCDSGYCGL
jgi:hypothetical protein